MPGISDEDVRWLLELLEQENLAEIEVREAGSEVLISASGQSSRFGLPAASSPHPPQALAATEGPLPDNHLPVLSPMAGVFYRKPSPDAPPFVEVGDHVEHGDTVGMVEAMKLFNEIPAPASGVIARFLVENEERVDADQPLMIIELPGPQRGAAG